MKGKYRVFQCALVMTLCGFASVAVPAAQNQLCKIFLHDLLQGRNGVDSGVIEVAKLVFYFAKDPEVRLLSDKLVKGRKQLTFLIPSTQIKNKECINMLEMLRAQKNLLYTINLEPVAGPAEGLNLSILFDPDAIEVTYDTFDSISLYKGLVFTFYDKRLLEKMKDKSNPLIRMAAHEKKCQVIIDCGHGGADVGATGYNGIQEKGLTLTIGLQVAALLKEHGITTFLTRDKDVFVPLDQRTRYGLAFDCDSIFISLHANFAENQTASGIETFCLSPPLLKRSFKTMKDYTAKILEYIMCDKYKKSLMLATDLHNNIIVSARQKNPHIIDRHVKHAVSQVLLGTVVPSVLIELGFISNKDEAMLLQQHQYQQFLAKGICDGVLSYFKNIKVLS